MNKKGGELMYKKCLVAYFTATGTTREAAEKIAEITHGDLYEMIPQTPYSSADLNWNDKNSRCVKEWKDKKCRPKIKTAVSDMESYETVFIGYPIWWESSPNIILTFLESYDFSRKTIIPFSTSGGSVRGSKGCHLQQFCPNANWKTGKLCKKDCSLNDIKEWIEGFKQ